LTVIKFFPSFIQPTMDVTIRQKLEKIELERHF